MSNGKSGHSFLPDKPTATLSFRRPRRTATYEDLTDLETSAAAGEGQKPEPKPREEGQSASDKMLHDAFMLNCV